MLPPIAVLLPKGLAELPCPNDEPVAPVNPGATPVLVFAGLAVCPPKMPLSTLARWRALTFCT